MLVQVAPLSCRRSSVKTFRFEALFSLQDKNALSIDAASKMYRVDQTTAACFHSVVVLFHSAPSKKIYRTTVDVLRWPVGELSSCAVSASHHSRGATTPEATARDVDDGRLRVGRAVQRSSGHGLRTRVSPEADGRRLHQGQWRRRGRLVRSQRRGKRTVNVQGGWWSSRRHVSQRYFFRSTKK